ncbi:hypothetical protein [Tahibacter sp.]|uniref:hypothetical protein n=1 Tax=Tahibacter sp. TaxID=2056211 RepID=UPI0028C4175D|nr:hypothetical protein [Tahibacter sp.]
MEFVALRLLCAMGRGDSTMRHLVNFVMSLSIPQRLVVSLVVGFVAGPAFIGFLSEYATYAYAMGAGVRPPVEGIPYLKASVTLGSLTLATAVAIVIWVARTLLHNLLNSFFGYAALVRKVIPKADASNFIANSSIRVPLLLGAAVGVPVLLAVEYVLPDSTQTRMVVVTEYVLFVLILLSVWSRLFLWISSAFAALVFYVLCLSVLFRHEYYGEFLYRIGFGGGQEIEIQIKDRNYPIRMQLELRSQDWLIGTVQGQRGHIEVPLATVERIWYLPRE